MNTLERSLVEKTGREHGWENILSSDEQIVVLASGRHKSVVKISKASHPSSWHIEISGNLIKKELKQSFPETICSDDRFLAHGTDQLALLFRRCAELAVSLPNQAYQNYRRMVKAEIKKDNLSGTEVERLIRQRVGQSIFKDALLDYWEGCCAVTGIALPQILRASHIKPWARCDTDEQRLDVFNGLLLCANLDALFDRGVITFNENGRLICSPRVSKENQTLLQLSGDLYLRWVSSEHIVYLVWHKINVFNHF